MDFEKWWEVQEELDRNPANEAFARPVWDARVPEGYVVVPVEAQEELIQDLIPLIYGDSRRIVEVIYKAMIQAVQEEE